MGTLTKKEERKTPCVPRDARVVGGYGVVWRHSRPGREGLGQSNPKTQLRAQHLEPTVAPPPSLHTTPSLRSLAGSEAVSVISAPPRGGSEAASEAIPNRWFTTFEESWKGPSKNLTF